MTLFLIEIFKHIRCFPNYKSHFFTQMRELKTLILDAM